MTFNRVSLVCLVMASFSLVPMRAEAAGKPGIVQLATGGEHCALKSDATLWCWGERRNYADGVIAKPTTEAVQVAEDVKKFGVGGSRGVAIRSDGVPVVWRWKLSPSGKPLAVTLEPNPLVKDAVDVALVASELVVLVLSSGQVVTWVPRAQEGGPSFASKVIDGITKAKAVACGSVSCCALSTDGIVACFEPSDARARPPKDVKGASEVLVGDTQAIVRTSRGPVILDLVPGRAPTVIKSRFSTPRYFRGACGVDRKGVLACPWMLGEELDVMPGLGRGPVLASVGGGTACVLNSKGKVQCRRYAGAARGQIDPVVDITFRTAPLGE